MLFSLLSGLPQSWGSPDWFGLFPYSYGLSFFLGLELYFTNSCFFTALLIIRLTADRRFHFLPFFATAFIPSVVFSLCVFTGAGYGTLLLVTRYSDV
ncbi:MAG: hypothetical protein LBU99_07420 [Spirochaetaceae bacterium]|nr:hypothetical protein [Spirochaetaceae bacterium]